MDFYIIPIDHIQCEDEEFSYQVTAQGNNLMHFCGTNIIGPDLLNHEFQSWFGKFDMDRITKGNYFLITDDYVIEQIQSEEELQRFFNDKNRLIHLFYGMAQTFSHCLWLVKDNSVNVPFGLYTNLQIGGGIPTRKNVMISNARGDYEVAIFTKEEFEKANEWLDILYEYYAVEDKGDREYGAYNNLSSDINQNSSSFRRALTYLEIARSTSFLPAKIASYISVLETLFAVADSNTYKTPERTAVFLGGTKEERSNNFKIVKDAYKVRSNYVHGSDIEKKQINKLDVISNDLDGVVRNVLIKFFTEFKQLNYSGKANYDKVNQYFVDLVLGGV